MKGNKAWIAIIVLLLVVIIVMAWILVSTPAPEHSLAGSSQAATTSPATTATNPEGVIVRQPRENATVGETFDVSGQAPNSWYFEAVFPIQVRDDNDDLIGSGQARAQSDWTVSGPVAFTATITLQGNYAGPATLILLKDNPSGLPQNDDELTVPITIQ